MSLQPSHRTATLGGAWTALGFVPFDVWLAQAQPASPHLVGLLWIAMAVAFLWAPIRILVVGRAITSLRHGQNGDSLGRAPYAGIALRALTWALSCAAVGFVLSVVLLMLGYEEFSG